MIRSKFHGSHDLIIKLWNKHVKVLTDDAVIVLFNRVQAKSGARFIFT